MSHDSTRSRFVEGLWERRGEIERETLARVYAISDPTGIEDPTYVAGLEGAVVSGLAYGLATMEAPRAPSAAPDPIPVQLLAQARHAARANVSLDTVLRRYFAGYAVLGDFVVREAERHSLSRAELRGSLRSGAALCDRLIVSVSQEYSREVGDRFRSIAQSRAAQVRMLLDGELVDHPEFQYELDAWHTAAIATGPGAQGGIRALASALDCRLLSVDPGDGTVWAWFGGRRRLTSDEVESTAGAIWDANATLALGEAGQGIEGWRLTHKQARAAMSVALRGTRRLVAYGGVALLAAVLSDNVLASSLRRTYLAPLEGERDGGAAACETLRAYFAAGRNASSAAAALRVSRKTVSVRLRTVEERIGRPLESCAAELETALCLRSLLPESAVSSGRSNAA